MNDSHHEPPEEMDPSALPLDRAITKALFRKWRTPRCGSANPERMNNPVWEWLVRSRATAYDITQRLGGPSALKAGPGWCFQRHGQSATALPDGRKVFIAGEHEDSYDPDFYIYNDVVVLHPGGTIDIFGYPKDVFPPTDFHSATLAGDKIYVIGCLGYPDARQPDLTPVYCVDTRTYAISNVTTTGCAPGWIYQHAAELSPDSARITVTGGRTDRGRNINDWRLDLGTGIWEQVTHRTWQVWLVQREDGNLIHLWQIRSQLMLEKIGQQNEQLRQFQKQFNLPTLEEELGGPIDAQAVETLFQPPFASEKVPGHDAAFNINRVTIEGVSVRYEESMQGIEVTFEGSLPQKTVNAVVTDLKDKLARLERHPCTAKRM